MNDFNNWVFERGYALAFICALALATSPLWSLLP